jgi:hypothetical protein
MATHPELIRRDVFIADADAPLGVVVDNGRQLFHFEALRVAAANGLDVGHNMIEIILGRIKNQFFTSQDYFLDKEQ